jgi:hypothetical protein
MYQSCNSFGDKLSVMEKRENNCRRGEIITDAGHAKSKRIA